MVKEYSLSKSERLSSKKVISSLFRTGRSVYAPPFRLIYLAAGKEPHPVIMAVSVPKRLFKRAVDRNLLKRRIREAYRLNKRGFYELLASEEEKSLHLLIQFQHKEILDYQSIEKGLLRALAKMKDQLKEG